MTIGLGLAVLLLGRPSMAQVGPPEGPVEGWTRSGTELRFAGKDLYGHIDGGAELFHELGFEELVVQGYSKAEEEIDLEIYRMEGPEAALGIYRLQTGVETPVEGLEARNTGNRYQLSVVRGSCFIQVNSFSGDENLLPAMTALARATLAGIPEEKEPRDFWSLLPEEGLVPGSERFIRGRYTLQPIFTFGEGDILQLGGEVFGQVADYRDQDGKIYTRIVIEYPTEERARATYEHLAGNLDRTIEVVDRAETDFTFRDFSGKFGRVSLAKAKMELTIHLVERPEGM